MHKSGKPAVALTAEEQSNNRSGVGKVIHMMKWSDVEDLNAVRVLSRFMTEITREYVNFSARHFCLFQWVILSL